MVTDACLRGLVLHCGTPFARNLTEIGVGGRAADTTGDGVVSAGKVPLGLELDIGDEPEAIVARRALVTELEYHLAPKDTSGVHVRHGDHVLWYIMSLGVT